MKGAFFIRLSSIEGTSSLVTLSPTLVDPALVTVVRAVDGQDTGLSAQPAEQPTSDQDFRPGLSSTRTFIFRAHWSRLLCF